MRVATFKSPQLSRPQRLESCNFQFPGDLRIAALECGRSRVQLSSPSGLEHCNFRMSRRRTVTNLGDNRTCPLVSLFVVPAPSFCPSDSRPCSADQTGHRRCPSGRTSVAFGGRLWLSGLDTRRRSLRAAGAGLRRFVSRSCSRRLLWVRPARVVHSTGLSRLQDSAPRWTPPSKTSPGRVACTPVPESAQVPRGC